MHDHKLTSRAVGAWTNDASSISFKRRVIIKSFVKYISLQAYIFDKHTAFFKPSITIDVLPNTNKKLSPMRSSWSCSPASPKRGGLPRPKGTCGKDRNVAIESAVLMGMLSFRDMTIGRSTDDGRTDVGNQRISAVPN